jgi:hypothetical protein
VQVNSFVGAFHDAVILYALALNESLEAGVAITNGSEITRRMWNRTFDGELVALCIYIVDVHSSINNVRFHS